MTSADPVAAIGRPATPDELLGVLESLGIAATTHAHAPVFTVEEAKHLRGALPGAHCKSLYLRDKKGAEFLVVCLEDRRLDMKALADLIGAGRLSFGSPERMRARLGVEPGSVTPFAAINDRGGDGAPPVRVVLDAEMMRAELVNYHPLVNSRTTALAPADLLRFLAATGHEPLIVDLAPATRHG
jgi:Ala-tRNA(Pro) deacylase